jgi:ABC-2 type transport system ATP-binding protein
LGATAVDNLSFNVQNNEVFGMVIPDGAGKTTTIRMLCGLIEPDGAMQLQMILSDKREKKMKLGIYPKGLILH